MSDAGPPAAPGKTESLLVTQATLARMFRRTTRRLHDLVEEEGMPQIPANGKGRPMYDLMTVVPWFIEYRERQAAPQTDPIGDARLKREELEVRRREIDLAEQEGKLITVEDLDAVVDELSEAFRSAVVSLPGTFAGEAINLKSKKQSVAFLRRVSDFLLQEMRRIASELEEEREE